MKGLKINFFTIFILTTSPALALISFNSQNNINSALYTTQSTHTTDQGEYDELRQAVTSCVTKEKNKSKKPPENYITNRTRELKSNKLTRPIKYDTQIRLSNNDRNPNAWRCSIDAQPNDKVTEKIKFNKIGHQNALTKKETITAKCLDEIVRLAAIDDWYVSECLSNKIKKNYNIDTIDDYYTRIYQFYNEPESTTITTSQQANNTSSNTTSITTITVSDYYNNAGIKGITVCYNNNGTCKQSGNDGKVTFTATKATPPTVSIKESSEYHCEEPIDIISAIAELDIMPNSGTTNRSKENKNSQHQFAIKCKKLCTNKDLITLNEGLKQQNQIKSCYKKNKTEYEITKCSYADSKPHNNNCKLYRNNIIIAGQNINIKDVKISLSKTTSNFKPAKKITATDPIITIEDIELDETKYINAEHNGKSIACEFKIPNNTKCDFDLLNDDIIEEEASSDITNDSTSDNNLNATPPNQNQQYESDEEQINEQFKAINQANQNKDFCELSGGEYNEKKANCDCPKNKKLNKNKETGLCECEMSGHIYNQTHGKCIEPQITMDEYKQIESGITKFTDDVTKKINSQCPSENNDTKCDKKENIINAIQNTKKTTLEKLKKLGKN